MRTPLTAAALLAALSIRPTAAETPRSSEPTPASLEERFRDTVQPLLKTHCLGCHGGEKPKGGLDLSASTSVDAVAKDLRHWELVREQVRSGAMPPAKAKEQPSAADRKALTDWIADVRRFEAKRTAGDP